MAYLITVARMSKQDDLKTSVVVFTDLGRLSASGLLPKLVDQAISATFDVNVPDQIVIFHQERKCTVCVN